jgi:hypothetical protein
MPISSGAAPARASVRHSLPSGRCTAAFAPDMLRRDRGERGARITRGAASRTDGAALGVAAKRRSAVPGRERAGALGVGVVRGDLRRSRIPPALAARPAQARELRRDRAPRRREPRRPVHIPSGPVTPARVAIAGNRYGEDPADGIGTLAVDEPADGFDCPVYAIPHSALSV